MSLLRRKLEKEADYCLKKPILNKAERRRVLNFKIIRHSKHYSERDKAEQNAYYWIEAAPGVMFHHGFSSVVVYPFNPAKSGKDNKTVYIPYEASSVLSSIGSIKGLFGDKA